MQRMDVARARCSDARAAAPAHSPPARHEEIHRCVAAGRVPALLPSCTGNYSVPYKSYYSCSSQRA